MDEMVEDTKTNLNHFGMVGAGPAIFMRMLNNCYHRNLLLLVVFTAVPSGLFAQGSVSARVNVGTTVGSPLNGPVVDAGIGWVASPHLELFGDVGHLKDVRSNLQDLAIRDLPEVIGPEVPIVLVARFPATIALAGARVTVDPSRRLSPFLDVAIGWARVRPDIHATLTGVGDVSELIRDFIPDGHDPTNHFASRFCAGVAVRLSNVMSVDGEYRLLHLAGVESSDTNQLVGSLGIRF